MRTKWSTLVVLLVCLASGCGSPAVSPSPLAPAEPLAPTVTPTAAPKLSEDSVPLVPYASSHHGIRGLVPEGWVEVMPGFFQASVNLDDPRLVLQFREGWSRSDFRADQSELYGPDGFQQSVGSMQGESLTWDLYAFEFDPPQGARRAANIALTDTEAGAYLVACGSTPDRRDELYDAVFVPVVDAFMPAEVAKVRVPVSLPARDYWPTDGWRASTPEVQGMDPERLAEMLAYIEERELEIRSVSVIRHGYRVLDEHPGDLSPTTRRQVYSASKSVISALIGIALERGEIESIDTPVVDLFPDRVADNLSVWKEAMTVEHLLTMTAGYDCADGPGTSETARLQASDDWVQHVLDKPLVEPPGSRFAYCDQTTFLLSALLSKTTGMSALDYARQHLFAPLGIADVQWNSNREWISFGYSGLYLRPDDMAKLGYLYLNGGRWDGQQVIPEGWVEASTRPEAPPPGEEHSWYDYGYQWWINSWQDYYAALGWRGQAILVVPRLDLVVVITSDLPSGMGYLAEDLLNFFIVPACEG